MDDLISRRALYEKTSEWEAKAAKMVKATMYDDDLTEWRKWSIVLAERTAFKYDVADAPSAQPEIVRCKDCLYGEQDEIGRWFCRSFGCQVGDENGNGFCADGERKDEKQDG